MNEEHVRLSSSGPLIVDPACNSTSEPGENPGPSDESALRAKARLAIQTGRLPNRLPDQMWGGPGRGARCAACGVPVRLDEVEIELSYDPAEDGQQPGRHLIHPRCFGAFGHELRRLEGVRLPDPIDASMIPGRAPQGRYTGESA